MLQCMSCKLTCIKLVHVLKTDLVLHQRMNMGSPKHAGTHRNTVSPALVHELCVDHGTWLISPSALQTPSDTYV